RDVALKVLLETHQGKTELVQRFVEEAQIAGQLQHPGVTPVYELSQFADRRPYFTMKLVKGHTLARHLAARDDPSTDRPRFLKIFEQICQTLAYAHARGVIHRDLKPSNIMVGSYGEVQVMDWGLAKVLADRKASAPPKDTSVIQTPRALDSTTAPGVDTRAGSVLGTPAYMPPEQACGRTDAIDERSDVFGLGAILCEILTGRPPYVGDAVVQLDKAARADLSDALARLDKCGADNDLVALARRCLSSEPAMRPRTAAQVAEAVASYLQSVELRLRRAETERAAAQVKAVEERKRRRVTLGLGAAVFALLALGSGVALLLQHQAAERHSELARQQGAMRQAIEAALKQAREHSQHERLGEARAVLAQAADRLGLDGPDDLRRQVQQVRADLELLARLDVASVKAATWRADSFDNAAAEGEYAQALEDVGIARPGESPEVVANRIKASAIQTHLVAAMDDWAWHANGPRRDWILSIARAADPDPWRDRFRDAAVWLDLVALEKLAREANVKDLSPRIVVVLGRLLMIRNGDAAAVEVLSAAQLRRPNDFWINFELGSALQRTGRNQDAIGYFRAALAQRPDALPAYNNLGTSLNQTGQWQRALEVYNKALALDPKFAIAYGNRGVVFANEKRFDEAEADFRQAVALEPNAPRAYAGLGHVLFDTGHFEEAQASLRKVLSLLPASHPVALHSAKLLKLCEQLVPQDQKLTAVLRGEARPKNASEAVQLAWIAHQYKRWYAAAARLYADAFVADPSLAADPGSATRYNAACYAALAGAGLGKDAADLSADDKARLRKQARDWLNADLALWTKRLSDAKLEDRAHIEKTLRHWQTDADLAGIRDASAVAKLPVEERQDCANLWAAVEMLRKRAQLKPP
ncbi:MAG: protein kinase, partial [Gemmataceae bacterium]|nr:protein kinase [Gemmataceae bacterium]